MKDNDIRPTKSKKIVDGISIHLDSPDAYRKLHKIMKNKNIPKSSIPTEFSDSDIGDDFVAKATISNPLPECENPDVGKCRWSWLRDRDKRDI
ncbi:hypothetical protein JTB14_024196 [Gonioctena quinquepunctata]|nr:hypothetical protein JTB14_024196 [Gonioctena quinquepunctata]